MSTSKTTCAHKKKITGTLENTGNIFKTVYYLHSPTNESWYFCHVYFYYSVQSLSRVWLFTAPYAAAHQDFLAINGSLSLLKLMSIKSVMPSNHIILCFPLLFLPSVFASIRAFSNESVLRIRWPNYRSFSFSISPSNGYSGLITLRIDWFDLLVVQGTLKSSPTP